MAPLIIFNSSPPNKTSVNLVIFLCYLGEERIAHYLFVQVKMAYNQLTSLPKMTDDRKILMMKKLISVCCLAILLTACSNDLFRSAAPSNPDNSNSLFDDPSLRTWGDVPFSLAQYVSNEAKRRHTFDISMVVDEQGNRKPQHHLTISGGGANGAYGAGILNGLTEAGSRPEYRLVTGVSTGAIIGLYAFLGEEFDDKLKSFYTQLSDKDLYETRYIWQLFSSASLLDTAPFEARVRSEINRELLEKVKLQYLRGRNFLVKTTNLDEQRPVIWNMGAIAMHSTPEAELLFESVIIASASIPGIFEPVLIPVTTVGVTHDEMHVDGGVIAQVFFMPENINVREFEKVEILNLSHHGHKLQDKVESYVWLINNSRIAASWHPTRLSIADIVGRSIATMIKFQGRSNIAQIYKQSELTGSSFNLSYIHDNVPDAPDDAPFDQSYMQSMYCYGYAQGLEQEHWNNNLPDYAKLQGAAAHNSHSANNADAMNIANFDWELIKVGLSEKISSCLRAMPQS